MRISGWVIICVVFMMLTACQLGTAETQVEDFSGYPKKSQPYLELIKDISENPSREAALTEQESSWDVFAKSPYAEGLRQFTPTTGKNLARGKCAHLGSYQPYLPQWSLRCGVIYAESLQTKTFGDYCNNRKVAEQRYNGGYWVIWELTTAKTQDLRIAETVCGTKLYNGRKRAQSSCDENYTYPRAISIRQVKYTNLGGELCR